MFWPRWKRRGDGGASGIEYAALLVLAAVLLSMLYVVIPGPVAARTEAAICEILHLGGKAGCTTGDPTPAGGQCQAFCPTRDNPIHPSDPVTAATKGNYAALGDSHASGEGANGIQRYQGASNKDGCHRASSAYPEGLIKQYTFKGGTRFVACSGATGKQIENGFLGEKSQLNALDAHTTTVTIVYGGEEMHFRDVIEACMLDLHAPLRFWDSPEDQCHAQSKKIDADLNHLFGTPPGGGPSLYQQTLEAVHMRAPNARILVSGYEHLFPDPPKKNYDTILEDDQRFLNAEAAKLNANIQRQVQQEDEKWYGNGQKKMGSFEYVDNWDALKGHEITSRHPWINGVEICKPLIDRGNPNCWYGPAGTGTFHPTAEGQRSMQRNYARELSEGPGRVLYDP